MKIFSKLSVLFLAMVIALNNCNMVLGADVSGVSTLAPLNSFNPYIDNQKIPDTLFFGVWEGDHWRIQYHPLDKDPNNPDNPNYVKKEIKAILQYDRYPKLKKVEDLVKEAGISGDYSKPKEALLKYYKEEKGLASPYYDVGTFNPKWGNSSYENILIGGYQYDRGEVKVTNEEQWYKIPLYPITNTYVLFALDKIGCDFLMNSVNNPSGKKPYLSVTTSAGRVENIEANAGTYIRAGVFGDRKFSNENYWKIREDGLPISDFTSRTYLQFDISNYNFAGYKEAYINFYGRLNTDDAQKSARILVNTATITGNIKDFTWNSGSIAEWNYTDSMFDRYDLFDFSPPPSATYDWINGCSRMYLPNWKARRYVTTKDVRYAKSALSQLLTYYQTRSEWQPRIMDSSWRAPALMETFFILLDNNALNGETATMLLKMLEYTAQITNVAPLSLNNQGSGYVASAVTLASYFPELLTQEYWEKSINRTKYLFNTIIYPDYQGYIEALAGPYEKRICTDLNTIISCIRDLKGEVPEEFWYNKLDNMLSYVVKHVWPNLVTPNYADDGGATIADVVMTCATTLNNDSKKYGYTKYIKTSEEYLYIVSQGKIGKKPDYTSILIPKSQLWMMKTTHTDPNGLALFGNNDLTSYHCHWAPLSVDVYAYGKTLLRESGSREYVRGLITCEVPLRAAYHNTITYLDNNKLLQNIQYVTGEQSEKINEWATTKTMDYVDASTNALNRINKNVSRKIMFLKELGFWIVSDYIMNTKKNDASNYTFTQTWSPNLYHNATINDTTKAMTTHYTDSPNIFVVPADPNELEWVTGNDPLDVFRSTTTIDYKGTPFSYQLIDFNPSTKLMYAKQQRNAGDVTFDTVLYPVKMGDNTTKVSIDRLSVNENTTEIAKEKATGLKININDNEKAYYYNAHDKSGNSRTFGEFTTDANVAFVDKDEQLNRLKTLSIFKGSKITDNTREIQYFYSENKMNDVTISFNGQVVDIQSSQDISNIPFHFYYPEKALKVLINGVESGFEQTQNYIFVPDANAAKLNVRNMFIDGRPITGFVKERYSYDYSLTDLKTMPIVTVDTDSQYTITPPQSLPGVAKVNVWDVNNPSNKIEYTINYTISSLMNADDFGSIAMQQVTTDYEVMGTEAVKTVDNDKSTYWQGHGANLSYLKYKTVRPIDINAVSMILKKQGKFKVEVSSDNINWQLAIPESLSGNDNELIKYNLASAISNISYIKITFTDNQYYQVPWVSIWGNETKTP